MKKDLGVLRGRAGAGQGMLTRRISVTAATSKASSVLSAWSPPLSTRGAQEAWKGNKQCSVKANEDEGTSAARAAAGKAMGGKGKGKDGDNPV